MCLNLSLGKVGDAQRRFLARNHRDLLLNWGQVHFRAANKGTNICHEKCTYRQHIDECQHVHMWAFTVFERIDPWDLGRSAFLHGISTLQKKFNSFLSSHISKLCNCSSLSHTPVCLLQLELHFAGISPCCRLPSTLNFPKITQVKVAITHFCNHISLQIFGPFLKEDEW